MQKMNTNNQKLAKKWPMLFRKNENGSVQSWQIEVDGNIIRAHFGRMNGKIQTTEDVIKSGKNIGRSNATSPESQAIAEANSKWEKKLKEGYNTNITQAQAGKVVKQYIGGGYDPMLAHKWRDHFTKMSFPAWTQPKLDGIRCIAMIDSGKCTLWTRTRKPILSVPFIQEQLEAQFADHPHPIMLDGELYNHLLKNEFEKIVSLVRREEPLSDTKTIQYHVYDMIDSVSFSDRLEWITSQSLNFGENIKLVSTHKANSIEEVIENFGNYRKLGYEGAMCRADTIYQSGRSYGLLKIKEFDDSEFKIIGIESGRGRMADCAVFVCETKEQSFRCKMEGSLDKLKQYLNDSSLVGKMLTVRYQGFTTNGIPRFPIGIAIRDYE